jgi:hypothetical protein
VRAVSNLELFTKVYSTTVNALEAKAVKDLWQRRHDLKVNHA